MNDVSQRPARNSGWRITFSRNAMLVFTPRTRNSWSERSITCAAAGNVSPQVVIFTSSES
jgi:hypothetical protein